MVSPQHWEAPPGSPPHPEPPHAATRAAHVARLETGTAQFDADDTDPGADGGGGGKFIALATAASLNLKSMLNDELMSMHLNPLFTASNARRLAWCSPKITRPFEAVAAPLNAWPPLYVRPPSLDRRADVEATERARRRVEDPHTIGAERREHHQAVLERPLRLKLVADARRRADVDATERARRCVKSPDAVGVVGRKHDQAVRRSRGLALWNLRMICSVELMSTQLNTLAVASNVPTQSALYGTNTTNPFGAVAAPDHL